MAVTTKRRVSDAGHEGTGIGRKEVAIELLETSIGLEGVGIVVGLSFGWGGRFVGLTGNEMLDHLIHILLKLNNLFDVVGLGKREMSDRVNLFLANFALMIHSNYLHKSLPNLHRQIGNTILGHKLLELSPVYITLYLHCWYFWERVSLNKDLAKGTSTSKPRACISPAWSLGVSLVIYIC